jgi:ribulose kinase
LHPDIASAVKAMASGGEEVKPDSTHRAVYDRANRLYVALYESVKNLYPECAAISSMTK